MRVISHLQCDNERERHLVEWMLDQERDVVHRSNPFIHPSIHSHTTNCIDYYKNLDTKSINNQFTKKRCIIWITTRKPCQHVPN